MGSGVGNGVANFLGKSAPPPPDYQGAANAQSQGSQVNMSGPFGSQQWTTGPNGQPMLTSGFSGPLDVASTNLQQQAAGQGALPTGSQAREEAIQAYMQQANSRLEPMFAQREAALRTQLANQGLDPSSQASQGALTQFGQERNDAFTSALNSAVGQGAQAGNMIFQQGLASQQLPYQQMAMLQALQGQQFGAASQGYQSPQALAAAIAGGNYGLSAQQIQNQGLADFFGGLTDLVGAGTNAAGNAAGSAAAPAAPAAAAALSDERAKQNITRLDAEALPGVPWATWEYKDAPGRRAFGVIAQDLEKVAPRFVAERDGIKWVDYSFLEDRE